MKTEDAIRELKKDSTIVITGPDVTDPNKLRVYANGGLIGKLYIGKRSDGRSELIDTAYYKHSEILVNHTTELEHIVTESNDFLATMTSGEYIRICKNVVEKRFGKKKGKGSEKERHVQTRIVKHFMRNDGDWNVIDMEMQCPKKWFEGNHFSAATTKQPRFDMIVLNKDGIGIIELKVNNENTDNMNSHYEHMELLLTTDKARLLFIEEMNRRICILRKYGIISRNAERFPVDRIWCGFLFVGGEFCKSKELIAPFRGKKVTNNLKFLYYPNYDIEALNIGNALCFDDFLSQ